MPSEFIRQKNTIVRLVTTAHGVGAFAGYLLACLLGGSAMLKVVRDHRTPALSSLIQVLARIEHARSSRRASFLQAGADACAISIQSQERDEILTVVVQGGIDLLSILSSLPLQVRRSEVDTDARNEQNCAVYGPSKVSAISALERINPNMPADVRAARAEAASSVRSAS